MHVVRRLFRVLVSLGILFSSLVPWQIGSASPRNLPETPQQSVQNILQAMTPEEKVGQLFLVTFQGKKFDEASPIYSLISTYRIGGVVLQASNDNFIGPDQTIAEAYRLISELQTANWTTSKTGSNDTQNGRRVATNYVPLFVGISQEGDGSTNDQIVNGLTPLPDLEAIGATWDPEMALQVGKVLGRELRDLGFNLFLGPSLDVLDRRYSNSGGDLGTRSFGGDPYWVGELGKSLISGVHQGSGSQVAVVSKYFPGIGSADRLPTDEVGTVRKSLDQIKQTELVPFYAVTGNSPSAEMTTDGLLVPHIRYQGLQGNIRPITRPVSLDPTALTQLMDLPPLSVWRQNSGGVIVSDDLGSKALRRFYDSSLQNFDARQVARDALLAGNDLLFADNFVASGDPDTYTTLTRTLTFFAQKYREDPAFAQRVDAAVTRILGLKNKLYPTFDITRVVPSQDSLAEIGTADGQQTTNTVASQAVTLISPSSRAELEAVLPQPPDRNDRIVFFTDTQTVRQCPQCPDQETLPVDALQNAILKLYGPLTSGQVSSNRLASYSFSDLMGLLNGSTELPNLDSDLRQANWIVFSMLDINSNRPTSGALRKLLSERLDLIKKEQRIIVFAFNAPYFLDATDISKVTAYYGLYSRGPSFIEIAAKVLFHEIIPPGEPPISVMGVGYDLTVATQPDPTQVIPLMIDNPGLPVPTGQATVEPTRVPTFSVGDTIPLRTGEVLDSNHHVVADGTIVRFRFSKNGDNTGAQQIEVGTVNGVARAAFRIDSPGLLEIRATAEPALSSEILQIDISKGESAGVTSMPPPPTPSETPRPSYTPAPTSTPMPTQPPPEPFHPQFGDWLLAMLITAGGAGLIYLFGTWWASIRWGLRWGLCALLGGLGTYVYMVIGLPGGTAWIESGGRSGVLMVTLFGVLAGWLAGVAWRNWLGRTISPGARR